MKATTFCTCWIVCIYSQRAKRCPVSSVLSWLVQWHSPTLHIHVSQACMMWARRYFVMLHLFLCRNWLHGCKRIHDWHYHIISHKELLPNPFIITSHHPILRNLWHVQCFFYNVLCNHVWFYLWFYKMTHFPWHAPVRVGFDPLWPSFSKMLAHCNNYLICSRTATWWSLYSRV